MAMRLIGSGLEHPGSIRQTCETYNPPFGIADVLAAAFLCACYMDSSLLGIASGERYVWFTVDVVALFTILARPNRAHDCLIANPWLTTWPVLAMISALWSITPIISFYQGLQLLMTILSGYVFQLYFGQSRLLKILLWAFVAAQILSIASELTLHRSAMDGGKAWLGIYTHKNVLGSIMALSALCSACLFLDGWIRPITGASFLGSLTILYLSHSTTGQVATLVGLFPLVVTAVWRRGPLLAGFVIGLAIAAGSVLLAYLALNSNALSEQFLNDVGKDRTLSGRTLLWHFASDQFWKEPWFGIGYKAYWESTSTPVEYLRFVIGQKLWFFHNNFYDVAIAFGVVGLAFFGLGLAACVKRACATALSGRSYANTFPLCFCLYLVVSINLENALFQNHSFSQFLLAALIPVTATGINSTARELDEREEQLEMEEPVLSALSPPTSRFGS
ncbi:O-antigen ligase family protein [Methylobacterium sp. WL18]|uniref:O-antigen ligase family protein n=1 Tax=Methylobacterium sp. WL18 TaxID=2603897 RepID=UPI0011CBFF78|nr:O-antigen ligase family protein [Methylobacterium sp. WL18]TXN73474.1 O-antigen ligase family protein [Methylobacterium sp. WL18]